MQFYDYENIQKIGQGSLEYPLNYLEYDFDRSERIVGFFGAATDQYITELGFITWNPLEN